MYLTITTHAIAGLVSGLATYFTPKVLASLKAIAAAKEAAVKAVVEAKARSVEARVESVVKDAEAQAKKI